MSVVGYKTMVSLSPISGMYSQSRIGSSDLTPPTKTVAFIVAIDFSLRSNVTEVLSRRMDVISSFISSFPITVIRDSDVFFDIESLTDIVEFPSFSPLA